MKKILIGILVVVAIASITLLVIGPMKLMLLYAKPHTSFAKDTRAPNPDYSLIENWAAHPSIVDPSDKRPDGITSLPALKGIDVFFIHPTGYLKGEHWNFNLDAHTSTEENTKWMMANQASVFSDCAVYAPRYRQATLFSFFDLEGADEQAALNLAYQDVEKAFDYFISQYNKDRPFIIASHSQGSFHALPLIKKKIDGTPLAKRMIAAYTIGITTITNEAIDALQDIKVCDAPDQTQCLIHWATFAEQVTVNQIANENQKGVSVCVNPLTWKRDGPKAEKALHRGYVQTSGEYALEFSGADTPKGMKFPDLKAPLVAHTSAACKNGMLLVEKQDFPSFLQEGNYHGLDFQLFHADIRANIIDRANAFWAAQSLTVKEGIGGY